MNMWCMWLTMVVTISKPDDVHNYQRFLKVFQRYQIKDFFETRILLKYNWLMLPYRINAVETRGDIYQ